MRGLFILLVLSFLTINLNAQAKIKFDRVELEFGQIDAGGNIEINFEFSNAGNETLKITKISSSCGCLAVRLEKKEYAPGERGTLPVTFFSRGYNGKLAKFVTVATNDEEKAKTRLKISGMVVLKDFAEIGLSIDKIDFGVTTLGGEYKETIKIKNTGTIELRITEITHGPDFHLVFGTKTIKPDQEVEVKLVFTPLQTGRYTNFLKIRTNSFRQRTKFVRISADVKEKPEGGQE
jgi:hypothetical protein